MLFFDVPRLLVLAFIPILFCVFGRVFCFFCDLTLISSSILDFSGVSVSTVDFFLGLPLFDFRGGAFG